ncbi:MAG: succinate dehydrogenase/fumarate reductase iron-sulfur subunit [Candidatus Marinimicrobia bacterium]|nr:succinate dehydrogenase/fumarate reductase iron-sulfur subunit [Candidatus Neomarinimicrobiota bacterium]|tara:strand:+ start:28800 stop:29540 length:741 start_codon:yes stop_codon:yes gene_type:complete
MQLNLKVWRQKSDKEKGNFELYTVDNVLEDMSFFEMLDMLNNQLIKDDKAPIAFDHDCREGICGTCGIVINGRAHGPLKGVTSCQLHMRSFKDGDTIVIEPWRSKSFPIVKDLVVNRTAFDRIMESGGYISVKTGGAPDANATPIFKDNADEAFDSATCIGCGACVATCKNASAMLFVSAKINQYSQLPQGQVEHDKRVNNMINQMDLEGFGSCTNTGACEVDCPKEISINNIIKLNKSYIKNLLS